MPRWDRRSIHRIPAENPPAVLFAAVEEVTWREVPVFRALLTLRGLGRRVESNAPILDWFAANGFRRIGRTDDEVVVVATQAMRRGSQAQTPSRVDSFRQFSEPGCIKIATNFVTADGFLITETRVLGTDARARRLFGVYWVVIRAGSGVIRRVWLHAIRSRARAAVATR